VEGSVVGAVSVVGVMGGAFLATSLDDDLLRKLFAAFILVVAAQLVWSVRSP
jgi:uncharacterized membrane protein YfcA